MLTKIMDRKTAPGNFLFPGAVLSFPRVLASRKAVKTVSRKGANQ